METREGEIAAHRLAASRKRDKKLYVRVNEDEKKRITERAARCRLSVSRFLARSGLADKALPTEEDKKRVEGFLLLFKRAALSIDRLHAEASALRMFEVLPEMERDIAATRTTLLDVVRELGRRL